MKKFKDRFGSILYWSKNNLLKNIIFWIITIEILIFLGLYKLGFKLIQVDNATIDWIIVSALGQWIAALVGLIIPITAVYFKHSLEKKKREISDSNIELYEEFNDFKKKYMDKIELISNKIDDNGNLHLDGGLFNGVADKKLSLEEKKEKALKYINIKMGAMTKHIAEHLNVSMEDAYDILEEMDLHDDVISHGGILRKENMKSIYWTKN